MLFGRYIFLYREFLDYHKLDSNNEGNFNEIRKDIEKSTDQVKEKIDQVLDKTDLDEKIVESAKKIKKRVRTKKGDVQ